MKRLFKGEAYCPYRLRYKIGIVESAKNDFTLSLVSLIDSCCAEPKFMSGFSWGVRIVHH
ncbi:MAG: hypothetical protein LBJ00_00650 [Planctomycetaceae bacterium]|nr:hypothetical protein [Planctomycetaceae bacterium]